MQIRCLDNHQFQTYRKSIKPKADNICSMNSLQNQMNFLMCLNINPNKTRILNHHKNKDLNENIKQITWPENLIIDFQKLKMKTSKILLIIRVQQMKLIIINLKLHLSPIIQIIQLQMSLMMIRKVQQIEEYFYNH